MNVSTPQTHKPNEKGLIFITIQKAPFLKPAPKQFTSLSILHHPLHHRITRRAFSCRSKGVNTEPVAFAGL